MNVLIEGEKGFGLYVDDTLTATWDQFSKKDYILNQLKARGIEEFVERKERGKGFPEKLSAQVKKKLPKVEKVEESDDE